MVHRFGDVEVDEDVGEIRVAGVAHAVEPQVMAVLAHLIRERHRVVPKDELLDEVWGDRFASASVVTSRIKSVRQAVNDSGRDQRVIRTVHGRGYRFVAELDGTTTLRERDGEAGVSATATPPPPSTGGEAGDPAESVEPGARSGRSGAERVVDEGWPLVAREVELQAMVGGVARADVGGVLVTGPAGLGKSRLARAAIETIGSTGAAVARINGHSEAARVPLAAFAHLLPDDVVDVAGLQGELARSVLFQRARSAIGRLAGDRQLVLMVDDVDRVDGLSVALIASLIEDGSVHAVMTQRVTSDEPLAMEHLIRAGRIVHLPLMKLPADQLVALLTRVLDGPVDPVCTDALVAASQGNPGMLRQLVESSVSNGTVERSRGIWTLAGRLAVPADMAAAIGARLDHLDRERRDALELVALAGDLDLDVVFDLVRDEVLDELELNGMITVREVGATARVRLVHPLFGEILLDQLSPIRARRHRARLADALSARGVTLPADRLQLVRLRMESDGVIDEEHLLESATLAIIEGDTALALRLAALVESEECRPRAMHLRGEALYLRGRFDEAGAALEAIDLDRLDDISAAFVLRRIATWRFFGRWEPDDALDGLAANFERWSGPAREALESYWVMIAAFDGRFADAALEIAERLFPAAEGVARIESRCGAAMAHLVRGELRLALDRLAEFRRELARMPPSLTWSGPYYASAVEVMTQLERGDPAAGRAVLDRDFGAGTPPSFRFVAFAAGRLALAGGEYQQTFDWLDPHIELGEVLGIQTNTAQMRASTALAALAVGDDERAAAEASSLRARLPPEPTLTRFELLWSILQVEAAHGDPAAASDALIAAAADARAVGNRYCEQLLLGAAVYTGAADRVADRLGELAATAEGALTPLRHRTALAVIGGEAGSLVEQFEAHGLRHDAWCLRRLLG